MGRRNNGTGSLSVGAGSVAWPSSENLRQSHLGACRAPHQRELHEVAPIAHDAIQTAAGNGRSGTSTLAVGANGETVGTKATAA